jgi:regulatory protein
MEISYKPGKMNKIHISIDGEYKYTVDAEYWYSCPWHGINIIDDPQKQTEFFKDIGSRYAFISGLRLLSYGDNSRKALRRKLVTKGHVPEYTDIALDKLEEYGYINDKRFSRSLRDKLINSKHMGKYAIKQELLRRGVDRAIIDDVLEEVEFDSVESIITLLNTKYAKCLNDEKGRRKTVAGLQRLGYNWSDIKTALSRVGSEREEFSDD